jgi:general secretion pathway protein M
MSAWWQRLGERDRLTLTFGALIAAAIVLWAFVWQPMVDANAQLGARVRQGEQDLAWMQQVASTLKQRRLQGANVGLQRAGRSLLALADGTAREAGLDGVLKRVEPVGEGRVNVWLENTTFDHTMLWLESLRQSYGVRVDELSIDRATAPGVVNARITLIDPPSN